MRNKTKTMSFILAMALLPVLAVQAQTLEVSGSADCEGWSAMATLTFPAGVYTGAMDYSMVLTDQAGKELTRFEQATQVYRYEDPVMMKMYGEAWGLVLDSNCVAQLVFHFMDQEMVVNFDVVCVEEMLEPNACRYSPGFWKSNPEAWPVGALVVGGVDLSQDRLMAIMKAPVRGNGNLLMARELIAAKLNVANGCDVSINATIEEADIFLMDNPLEGASLRNSMRSVRTLRQGLSVYNKAGCGELVFDSDDGMSDMQSKSLVNEEVDFSSLKAMYR